MKHITIVVILLGMTLLTACESRSDRARAMAEEAGLPEAGIEYLIEEFLPFFSLLSIEIAPNVEYFRALEIYSNVFGNSESVWCLVMRPEDGIEEYFDTALVALTQIDDNWNSLTMSETVLENDMSLRELIVDQSNCSNWNEWSENQ